MVMVIYGYPKLPEGFQEEKWGTGWRVALRFSKWVDSQTLVMFMMAIPRSYMFCGERLATAIALWNLAPKWDSCEPVQNMLNVLVTFLNDSGWRVWPQNHLTDVSLAQSSRRNSLMDPKMVWTIANWWGFQFLVISKMERVWIMITVKMVDKRGEPHAVPSSRGSLKIQWFVLMIFRCFGQFVNLCDFLHRRSGLSGSQPAALSYQRVRGSWGIGWTAQSSGTESWTTHMDWWFTNVYKFTTHWW